MWAFLLLLAIVPLTFFWSDSVLTIFPQLAPYLPAKTASAPGVQVSPEASAPLAEGINRWVETTSEQGYVAWTLSQDGRYRLAIGCQPKQPAALQVTQITGEPFADPLTVNYSYGTLPLKSGFYVGSELVGAVSQFKDIYLQRVDDEAVLAQFQVDSLVSGTVARSIQSNCAP